MLDLVKTQFIVLAPGNQLELAVVCALGGHAAAASPKKFLGLVVAVSRKDGHGLGWAIHGGFGVVALVVEEQVAWLGLGHGEQAMSKWRMASSPDGEIGANDPLRRLAVLSVVPELDALVKRASNEAG
jgi:hypothetical protein